MIYKSYIAEENINLLKENCILFYGENLGLKNEFKDKIKTKNQAEIIIFTQEEIIKNKNSFYDEILNISLFEEKKIYLINQCDDKILDILKEAEKKLTDQNIYLFADLLEKRSKLRNYFEKSNNLGIVPCYNDNEISLKRIITRKLNKFKELSPENINLILNKCGSDRSKLNNELDKIITFFTNKKLEQDKLEIILDPKINDDFNILKDSALSGEKNKTNNLLSETVIEAEKNIYYLNIINQRLNSMLKVNELSKKNGIESAINSIKPPIFWKDKPKFLSQVKKWNKNKIKNMLDKTYNLEIEIKSNSNANKNLLIKKLIVDLCCEANS